MISFNMHSYAQDASAASVSPTLAADHGVGLAFSTSGQGYWRAGSGPIPARQAKDAENGLVAVSIAENQRGELRTADVAAQLTSGGGKPGQGYPAVLAFTERGRENGRNLELQSDIAYALTNPGAGGRTQERNIAGTFGVRRLTPRECERLQGFPDDYTAWGIDEQGNRIEMSDSTRYRMLGNAVCRNVSAWIDQQIVSLS